MRTSVEAVVNNINRNNSLKNSFNEKYVYCVSTKIAQSKMICAQNVDSKKKEVDVLQRKTRGKKYYRSLWDPTKEMASW